MATRYTVNADIALKRIAYGAASDGCLPRITCDLDLDDAAILAAHRYQPNLERRLLFKSVQYAAAVLYTAQPGSRLRSAASSSPCSSPPSSNAKSVPGWPARC